MKTEIEIKELHNEMLYNTEKLYDMTNNPPDGMSFEDIKIVVESYNAQCHMNALIEWVLKD